MFITFKLHLENANPRAGLIDRSQDGLGVPQSVTQPDEVKANSEIDESEENIKSFIKSINDVIAELKIYHENKSSGTGK